MPSFYSQFVSAGTYSANLMHVGLTGAGDRNYYFSHYDDDDLSQAGLFCWRPIPYLHCEVPYGSGLGGTLFGDATEPLGVAASGFAEVFVR